MSKRVNVNMASRRGRVSRWSDELVLRTYVGCGCNYAATAKRLGCAASLVRERVLRMTFRPPARE
jgi:hypothetical protein